MQYPEWVYDGTNGDTLGDSMLEYGIGQHILTGTKNYDVILPGIKMVGHSGLAYGLCSDMYYGHNYGVILAITGVGHEYEPGHHSTFYKTEESIFEVVRELLFDHFQPS